MKRPLSKAWKEHYSRGQPDCWNLPLFLLCSDHPVHGPALTLLKKDDHPYPKPQTFKNTSEFPIPLGISQECQQASMVWWDWGKRPWESTEPTCLGQQLTLGQSTWQTKNGSVLSAQEFVRSHFKRPSGNLQHENLYMCPEPSVTSPKLYCLTFNTGWNTTQHTHV